MYKKAFGKINIILKVKRKKANESKHQIDSVMQICHKMYDKIKIKPAKNFNVRYINSYKQVITFDGCSISKIVRWFKSNFPNSNTNFQINVVKNIPVNSGFGGESTDAAFVLNFLIQKNEITELTNKQIEDIAINVGSDIPFFLTRAHTAHVTGYGDKVKILKKTHVDYRIYPIMEKCSSKNVYQVLDNDKNFKSEYTSSSLYVDVLNAEFAFTNYYNDLQKYVFQLYPEVKKNYDKLNKFTKHPIIVNGAGSYLIIFKVGY